MLQRLDSTGGGVRKAYTYLIVFKGLSMGLQFFFLIINETKDFREHV